MSSIAVTDLKRQMDAQPLSALGVDPNELDSLIVSMRKVDGVWRVLSRYGDDIWWTTGSPTNVPEGSTKLDFSVIPAPFRAAIKACMYRYKSSGREGGRRPSATGLVSAHERTRTFLVYVASLGIKSLSGITPFVCTSYVQFCQSSTGDGRWGSRSKSLSPAIISHRLRAVEALFELSQFSDEPMKWHPWPETTACHLSKVARIRRVTGNTTPLISDDDFVSLFQQAWGLVQSANELLDLRDGLQRIAKEFEGRDRAVIKYHKNLFLRKHNWGGNLATFIAKLMNVRAACYVVVASLSGCRNHELGFLRKDSCYSTVDDQGERYWWMRSISTKTGEGSTEWMVPEAAVTALRVMDRWAEPYQKRLEEEIGAYRADNPADLRIAVAQEHLGAIFVGSVRAKQNQVRTLSLYQMNEILSSFAKLCGLEWKLASHQFRRKFANYAARSRFGDLRYLKAHFKHWSLDMTLGYALNESQEMSLYLEIESELGELKQDAVAEWVTKRAPLSGGYGSSVMAWRDRNETISIFKNHAHMIRSIANSTSIRSNGHAWCTADDTLCSGNDVNPTRCGDGCGNAVIGQRHAPIYVGLYNHLKTLQSCKDIGEGGLARVSRDLDRCRSVLTALGHDPLGAVV